MLKYIFIGVILISYESLAARLDTQYIPPNSNSICSCGPNSGQKSYQAPQSSRPYQQQPQQYQQQQQHHQQQSQGQQIPILKYEHNNNGDGSYNFAYEAGNGIKHDEQGSFRSLGPENGERVVMGSYSYTDTDGKEVTVNYKADSNGFVATGDHLPTPPPIPEEIQESLKLTAPGYNPYQTGSTPQQAPQSHHQSKMYNQQTHTYNQQQTYTQPQSQYQHRQVSSTVNTQPQSFGGYYQQQTSTNSLPGGGGISVQASHSTGFGRPATAFASQSSFGNPGSQQATYVSQSSFSSPTNTYLPPN